MLKNTNSSSNIVKIEFFIPEALAQMYTRVPTPDPRGLIHTFDMGWPKYSKTISLKDSSF